MELATLWWAIEINSKYVQNPPGKPDKGSFQEWSQNKGMNNYIEGFTKDKNKGCHLLATVIT